MNISEPTIVEDMTNECYHRRVRGMAGDERQPMLSVSGIKELSKSPMHFRHLMDHPKDPTPAMQIGTVFHALTLEPDTINEVMAVAPAVDRRTKAGKAAWADFQESLGDRIAVKPDDFEKIQRMALAVHQHPEAAELLGLPGMTEVSVFWTDYRGFWCKCRPDRLTEDGVIIDLKSTDDASPEGFARACAKYKYHWQAAWYLAGLTGVTRAAHRDFRLIAVEKDPPYGVGVYRMPQVYTDIALEQMWPLLDEYARCLKANRWPGYSDQTEIIQMPVWALKTEQYREVA